MSPRFRRLSFVSASLASVWVGCALPTLPAFGADTDVGRLFFTPLVRQDLDARRKSGGEDPGPSAYLFAPPPSAPREVVVNGLVVRGSAPPQVWLNGVAVKDQPDFQVHGPADHERRVRVQSRTDGSSARLKPGQAWAPQTGRIRECFDCAGPAPAPAPTPASGNP